MKVIFAKYNNERLPQFNIVTKIMVDENGKRMAVKAPLLPEASSHIDNICSNYHLLKNRYNDIVNIVEPVRKKDAVYFEMAEGVSLEQLLLAAIDTNNSSEIDRLIQIYCNLLDSMVDQRSVIFSPTDEFCAKLGEWTIDTPQDIIELPNMDLLFSNIFIHNNKRCLHDRGDCSMELNEDGTFNTREIFVSFVR